MGLQHRRMGDFLAAHQPARGRVVLGGMELFRQRAARTPVNPGGDFDEASVPRLVAEIGRPNGCVAKARFERVHAGRREKRCVFWRQAQDAGLGKVFGGSASAPRVKMT